MDVQNGGSTAPAATYIGVDRRQARSASRRDIKPAEISFFIGALILVGVALPTALTGLPSLDTAEHAQAALRSTWAMLFVCAGLFRLVRWRLTGEASTALLGSGMLCFGLLSAPTAALAPLIQSNSTDITLSPITRAVAVTVFVTTLGRSFWCAPVDARVQPGHTIARLLASGAGVLAIVIAAAGLHARVTMPGYGWMSLDLVLTACWLVLAAVAVTRGVRQRSASHVWIGTGLFVMSGAEFLHAVAFVGPLYLAFFGTCLQVVVGGIALTNSAADLGLVFSADGNRLLSLSGALHEAEQMLTEEEQEQEERLHDARSVIAALKAASITLDRYDERLDTEVKHSLRSSLVSELARLERVIDGRRREPLQAFRLDVALGPVLTAERENGLVITNKLGSVKALGRPLELATVVQNLLVNARRYAPGSVVRISATSSGGRVQILVEDRGPGVDPTQHEMIFQRGYRCRPEAAGGSGLGLYLARRLMREQDGEIVLRERPGGGASFVLSLQAASGVQQPKSGLEVSNSVDASVERATDEGNGATVTHLPRQRHHNARGGRVVAAVGDNEVHLAPSRRTGRNLKTT
jgi:signal transduction histidine kinase